MQKSHTEAKGPHAGKMIHEGEGANRGKDVNFKRGVSQIKFLLAPLKNFFPVLPLSK